MHFYPSCEDKLVWKGNSNGCYSTASFYKEFHSAINFKDPLWKIIWSAASPPKVKIFGWQIMKGRVAVKAELVRRRMINIEATALCPLCKVNFESVNHLFFHCKFSWAIWSSLISEKNLNWGCPGEPSIFLMYWVNLVSVTHQEQWTMLFFVVIWSIWLFRNQMVFNGQGWDQMQLLNTIKCRYAFWFNAKWPNCRLSVDDILRGYESVQVRKNSKTSRSPMEWLPPIEGCIKINVDGAANGKPGPAGIGGIMRDHSGAVLAIFSKSVGIEDSNIAEFLAIREAVLVFKSSRWSKLPVMIESDSKNAVLWANFPEKVPWNIRNVSNHLSLLKQGMVGWQCVHIFREANSEADTLAKQGVSRQTDLVSFLA